MVFAKRPTQQQPSEIHKSPSQVMEAAAVWAKGYNIRVLCSSLRAISDQQPTIVGVLV